MLLKKEYCIYKTKTLDNNKPDAKVKTKTNFFWDFLGVFASWREKIFWGLLKIALMLIGI
jgi:hypothetical protein